MRQRTKGLNKRVKESEEENEGQLTKCRPTFYLSVKLLK